MAVSTTSGARLFLGPTVSLDALELLSVNDAIIYFEGLTWVEVDEVENFGDVGDTSDQATFASVTDRRMRKMKTVRDAGTMSITVGRDPRDPGQNAMIAAEKTDYDYAFKIEYKDARDESSTDSIDYFGGQVTARAVTLGGVSDVTKRGFVVTVNTPVYEDPSAASVIPTNSVRPSIYGTSLAQGATLTADVGVWNGALSYTYQWQADTSGNGTFVNIGGATASTHVLAVGQAGDAVRVQVIGVNGIGSSAAVNSLPVGLVGV